ncbi:MAG: LysR family transcriptional regulator [Pseudomonadota bacterium]|nr:LysR family transcriptional regulator [Pseudomonadota bacterium]
MGTIDLNLLRAFAAVHETGSFSQAATRLGGPRSTVSRSIAQLEESLGVALFVRTTRAVTTTAAGRTLYDRMSPALAALVASLEDLPERAEAPSGTLRITSTADLGTVVLAEAVARYTARYPGTRVDLHLTTAVVDLARDGFDLALRVSPSGVLPTSSLIARPVGRIVFQLYASPHYLARRGTPRSPEEMAGHDLVTFLGAPPLRLSAGTTSLTVADTPRVSCDDTVCARELLRLGAGIGALPSFLADDDVATGALTRVMPRWVAVTGRVFLVHPVRKHVPARVTAFRDLLGELLRQRPLSPLGPDAR